MKKTTIVCVILILIGLAGTLAFLSLYRIVARHSDMVIVIVSHHQVVQMLGVKSRFRQIVGHISHDPLSRCPA